ncbi:PHD finger family protein [Actinidia rufa]|uniref:PHD finger family protein n=1 Tax=Actinidia rufa TaxID=165716 RepID=A0A7J0FLG8_9ERIC|nr:PHD finger family protein [Actinidia rufa]
MEPVVIRSERRGRKRRNDVQNTLADRQVKKQVVGTRGKALVGRYVKKEFEGSGIFLGKIVYYDTGLYRIEYEDGDSEDLESSKVRGFLIEDGDLSGDLISRKNKLDELLAKKDAKEKEVGQRNAKNTENAVNRIEASSVSELSNDASANEIGGVQIDDKDDDDADSSSDSCEHAQDQNCDLEVDAPVVPPPELPPSSGNIGVPEEYVSHLFSVYSFLRSFSIRLFLSPFGLDDFVGSLNCPIPNTLLDAIHVALMRALRRHLEMRSSDGSELASKCLRLTDWSLLDTLTWPIYLVQYFMVMGYANGPEWRGFYGDVLEKDYYTSSAARKLMILQVLCDDVLESEELRAEIDMREESEVGIDSDAVAAVASENGPRRVYPRYPKTSACKSEEAVHIIEDAHGTKSSGNSNYLDVKGSEMNVDTDIGYDGNSDECRLCGMDGTLLCCDGCPSAYHSRCIGVSKMFIPEGAWYCPECSINKIGPMITRGTSLKGAEILGIDSYGQVFLGACDHLLVVSINTGPCLRYYHQNDIPKVLQALHSSVQHIVLYTEICKGILQYWEIKKDILPHLETAEMGKQSVNIKEDCSGSTPLLTLLGKESRKILDLAEGKNLTSCVTENSVKNMVVSCLENSCKEPGSKQSSLDTIFQTRHLSQHSDVTTAKQSCHLKSIEFSEHSKVSCNMSSGLVVQLADSSEITHQSFSGKLSFTEFVTCTSGNSNGSYRGHVSNPCIAVNMSSQSKEGNKQVAGRGCRNSSDDYLFMGTHFKSQKYVNNYTHGDFAASAAANLAILSSEENQVFESQVSDSRRKVVSANNLLQVKAFSSASIRFFWPNSEKKLVELPRERCGWCLSCKASVTCKKGCLLNAAVSNAIKGAMKFLAGLCPVKNGEGSLSGIAMYVMLMEESLYGLTIGTFQNASYRKQWRKQVEQATTCGAIKALLLNLEENIRAVTFSGDWVKLVDDWSVESSVTRNATFSSGSSSTHKRGRPGRKQSAVPKVTANDSLDNSSDVNWWRGGILSKLILQRGVLPCSMVKRAARQGGCRKIPGIHYAESSEIPKRSRQYIWRAAVEMSKNASQLALQVRYLDLHVRWNDLVHPELNLQDGKGPETEASAFRNTFICDKKNVANKIIYGVVFGDQKHLPSRVLKNIVEIEQSQDGREKYWFSETHIPLYLIKDYEQKANKMYVPLTDKPVNGFSKLQRRQLKASCFCHEQCIISSTIKRNDEVEFLITCKECCHTKTLPQTESSNESPTSPLLLQGQESRDAIRASKGAKQKRCNQSLTSVCHLESPLEIKSAMHDSSVVPTNRRKLCSWGLIWKKNKPEKNGVDFRMKNILLRGNSDMSRSGDSGPICDLCSNPYNSNLTYICCETCTNWYHGEAVELDESKIAELVGFKCCRCRRIRTPMCPYLDPEVKKKLDAKRPRIRASKVGNSGLDPDHGTISGQPIKLKYTPSELPKTEEVVCVKEEDPLISPLLMVKQSAEHNLEMNLEWNTVTVTATSCGTGTKKLPIRRHTKNEKNVDGIRTNNLSQVELFTPIEPNNLMNPAEEPLPPHVEWDVSRNGFDDGIVFDCEGLSYGDMEFEPQTYFSFTELLVSDDVGQLDEVDASGYVMGDWENGSAVSRDESLELCGKGANNQQDSSITEEPVCALVPCRKCSLKEPCPDLYCEICGLWMHRDCSPWDEQRSWEGNWRCGHCREWL